MLQDIRDKSQGIVVKIIVGFIVVTFALFGVDALVNSFTTSDTVASVDGTDITRTQMLQGAETQRRQLISMMNGQINPALLEENLLQRRALDELIQRAVLASQADKLGLGVSDAQVDSYIVQSEQFQTANQFDQNKYLNFVRSLGYTPLAFKERIKQDVLIQQTRNAVAGSEFVLPYQVDAVSALQSQQRSYDYVTFSLADEAEQTSVTDEELQAYYDAHKESFKTPEQVKIDYVVVSSADFYDDVQVTDAELNEAYQASLAGTVQEERLASHILIETSDRSDEEADQVLAEIETKLAAGEDFSALAAEYSDDIGSKNDGGNLGYITKGSFGDDFEAKLFSMNKGDVESVETQYGIQLIKLVDIASADAPTLEDMRQELTETLLQAKARDALLTAHEDITDLAYASDQLAPIANEYGVEVQQSDYFGRNPSGSELTDNPLVVAAAYGVAVLEDGQNSDLIELSDDQVMVLRLNDHKAEAVQSFEETKELVTSRVVEEKAVASLQTKAESAKQAADTQWTSVELASRGQDEMASLAFTLPHPQGEPSLEVKSLASGDLVLIRLNTVIEGAEAPEEQEQLAYQNYLNQTQVSMNTLSQQTLLEASAEIER
ncbi:SurA N-terminal domain-containing protein [Marinomonas dokdonensis]|uniref:SurA N-terminal domain-containing protein n=1 Tax=Marinomonas dokdonensis TaxID=328224 RepID=UPI0040553E4C